MHVYEVDLVQSCILVMHSPNLPLVRPKKTDVLLIEVFVTIRYKMLVFTVPFMYKSGQKDSCVTGQYELPGSGVWFCNIPMNNTLEQIY